MVVGKFAVGNGDDDNCGDLEEEDEERKGDDIFQLNSGNKEDSIHNTLLL